MITKEGFILATGMEPDKAEKMFNDLNERFDGDWEKASEYLQNMIKYLQKHQ